MIDFHSHIVYGVDDGSESIENSIKILKEAERAGFDKIILTPHYMEDYYEFPKDEIENRIIKLRQVCKEENINIELYQGNEIYITNNIDEYLRNNIASSMNDSRYVLFETPMNVEPQNLLEVIYKIKGVGKVPVLAHPERYAYIQKNPNRLLELIDEGVLLQSNYGSIAGQYGENAVKTVKKLIKNNFIHFLGSDVHKEGHIYRQIDDIIDILSKWIEEDKIEELTTSNIEKVINDEEIEIEMPIPIKEGFFSKIFDK